MTYFAVSLDENGPIVFGSHVGFLCAVTKEVAARPALVLSFHSFYIEESTIELLVDPRIYDFWYRDVRRSILDKLIVLASSSSPSRHACTLQNAFCPIAHTVAEVPPR